MIFFIFFLFFLHLKLKISASLTEADLVCIFSQRMERELKHRQRLQHVHTLEHVIELLKNSQKIMILTGAGVSVSCGIPDFRSPDGVYSRLSEFELDDPTQMFEFEFFSEKPEVFYSFAREIFPSNFTPSSSHNFIKLLEDQGRLLRNYTQNIDTLEQKAGIQNVLQCHGSFATASCIRCKFQVPGDEIKDAILKQQVAYCKHCASSNSNHGFNSTETSREQGTDIEDSNRDGTEPAVMKPDIVFFGERLPSAFDDCFEKDRNEVDLLIVIGSSLKVAPVSDIMHQLPKNIPQILINRTPITHMEFDVQLLGNCDTIVAELCRMAGWELRHERLPGGTSNVPNMGMNTNADGSGRGGRAYWSLIEPNTYIFEGAILGDIEYESSQSGSKKRGCFDHCVVDDYGISSDEDEESQRRTSFLRVGRFSSPGVMDMDSDDGNSDGGSNDSGSDSDSDSNESQHTVRSISIVPTNSGTSNSAIDSVICPSLVTPSDMASEAIGSRCSVPDIRAGTSSSPSLPSSQEEPCARRQPHEERDDKSKLRATLEGRTPQGASKIELESIVESGGTRSPSHDYNCAHEIRQLSVDSDLVFDDSLKATILLQQDGNVVSQVINELPGQSSLITEPMEENIDHGHKC
ncbi:DHS-like NAD/FAD-binding domain-containing protein [Lobosporangium transversale]|uniref:DHS-like NAD/FAD-binding domain-containing protein n=1 Tax=Lobosporangium transversale TaxID=64571 RepID=A0A1Y2GPY2_9FUNG|nr:DHS-like NAD/FAD-binding domain-containing protein [Lobosporangium transversale]ORZ13889.1 DHS-like NAD/FAD-binding domain-containing protein [Lobosporangium transversale]|eukprot:XP_021880673.1 DHS-like NAD/FAD-binding domain-containing protein [Lobosporangium transversale]